LRSGCLGSVFGEREVPGRVLFLFVASTLAQLNKGRRIVFVLTR